MCDWEGCTTGMIGLPDSNPRSVVKTPDFLHPYIYTYTARVPRDRFLAFEGGGITRMGQPSREGIALFSVRIEFWRSTALSSRPRIAEYWPRQSTPNCLVVPKEKESFARPILPRRAHRSFRYGAYGNGNRRRPRRLSAMRKPISSFSPHAALLLSPLSVSREYETVSAAARQQA